MKRAFAVLLTMIILFGLIGCGAGSKPTETNAPSSAAAGEAEGLPAADPQADPSDGNAPVEESSGNTLVVYFSRTGEQYNVGVIDKGNTAVVAEMIGDQLGADLWEILPADDHYPMTYQALTDVAKQEQNEKARPAYAGQTPELSQYDTIFIGAPVWWGDWPMILYTFFENNADELSGRTLIPFSTHEGSGLSGFDRKLSSACPDSTVGEGLAIRGSDAQNRPDEVRQAVNEWLEKLGY